MREPEGKYETHFTPASGSGHSIGLEMASVVRFFFFGAKINAPESKGEGERRLV